MMSCREADHTPPVCVPFHRSDIWGAGLNQCKHPSEWDKKLGANSTGVALMEAAKLLEYDWKSSEFADDETIDRYCAMHTARAQFMYELHTAKQ